MNQDHGKMRKKAKKKDKNNFMKITKLGHCCLVIEEGGINIMTDPGAWTTAQTEQKNINIILITHEHQDHLHIDSLKTVLKNNPQAQVITNSGVGKILEKEKIAYTLLEDGNSKIFDNILIEGFGKIHAHIYKTIPQVINTGYYISNRFFYPGDSFYIPPKPVEILALPVAGTWMKISEAIDYALALKPKHAFPVHDGMLKFFGPSHLLPQKILASQGINFIIPEEGKNHQAQIVL